MVRKIEKFATSGYIRGYLYRGFTVYAAGQL